MRTIIIAVAAVAAAIAPAAAAAPDIIAELLGKADEAYAEQGYKPTGWVQQGKLAKGESVRLNVRLNGGSEFQMVGACDTDCDDLDIVLLDANGKEVDRDDKKDDFPIVGIPQAGDYVARVTMVQCDTANCQYGVKAFAK